MVFSRKNRLLGSSLPLYITIYHNPLKHYIFLASFIFHLLLGQRSADITFWRHVLVVITTFSTSIQTRMNTLSHAYSKKELQAATFLEPNLKEKVVSEKFFPSSSKCSASEGTLIKMQKCTSGKERESIRKI